MQDDLDESATSRLRYITRTLTFSGAHSGFYDIFIVSFHTSLALLCYLPLFTH